MKFLVEAGCLPLLKSFNKASLCEIPCESLNNFNDMQQPSRDQLYATTPRKPLVLIPESPEYCELELDSMVSQSSKSTRKRLQEKFRTIGMKLKLECKQPQIQDWMEEIARA